jgi:hypothetical protein
MGQCFPVDPDAGLAGKTQCFCIYTRAKALSRVCFSTQVYVHEWSAGFTSDASEGQETNGDML